MKSFRMWLEDKEQNVQDTLLSLLGMTKDEVDTPLESLDPQDILSQLRPLGVWNSLPDEARATLSSIINNKIGNVSDLIKKIQDFNNTDDTSGLQPPIQ